MRFALSLLICACLFTRVAITQAPTSTIAGQVVDSQGSAVPRAVVRLQSSRGETTIAQSGPDGTFAFHNLPTGDYVIECSLLGFAIAKTTAQPGADLRLVLKPAPVRENVVVTPTRTEAPTSQIGEAVTVFTSTDMEERHERSLPEVLRFAPGVTIARSGGMGSITSTFIRGGESDYTRVLIDGIPVNEPGGTFQFENLTTENLDRVEVVRGSHSALFGSDAMAGVIQLFTAHETEKTKPRLLVLGEGGKLETWRAGAGLTQGLSRADYSVYGSRFETDNELPSNHYDLTTLSGNLGFKITPQTSLRLILRGSDSDLETPGAVLFGSLDTGSTFSRADGYAGLSLQARTSSWDHLLLFTHARSRQVSRDVFSDPPFTPSFGGSVSPFQSFDFLSDFLNDSRRSHFSYQSDFRVGQYTTGLGAHILTFAFDWDGEGAFLQSRPFGDPTRAQRDNFGLVFQEQWLIQRTSINIGARFENNGSFGTTVVPRVALAHLLSDRSGALGATKLKASFGLGIKEPTIPESFSPSPDFPGNPDLRPERSRSFDVGVEQRFWNDRTKIDLNWFSAEYRELVAFLITSFVPLQGSFFNVGESEAKGAELAVEVNPVSWLRGRGTYTYLDGEIVRSTSPLNPAFRQGQELLRRPRNSGSLTVLWDWRRLGSSLSTVFVGRSVDSDFAGLEPPVLTNPSYTRSDFTFTYRSPHRATYYAAVENLWNKRHTEILGFPALQRTYRVGARVQF